MLLLVAAAYAAPAPASRLTDIQARGFLTCGVHPGVSGFAAVDARGDYSGFDVDLCRTVATAILGRADAVRFVAADAVDAFLRHPDIDLVIRRLTWTLSREAPLGLMFGPIVFYDGQSFLAPKSLGAGAAPDLSGRRICVDPGEDWAGNLARFSEREGLRLQIILAADQDAEKKLFFSGRCDAYSADESMLGAIRADGPNPGDYVILPAEISKEPLAPLLRQGDDQFFQIVRWTIFALIDAEELGVTSANAADLRTAGNQEQRDLLDSRSQLGPALGLSGDWALAVIRAVGNYGEIFARDIGSGSALKLDRGLNDLWTRGGLLYAPPVR